LSHLGPLRLTALAACVGGLSIVPLWALPSANATAAAGLMHALALVTALVCMLRSARSGDPDMRLPRKLIAASMSAVAVGSMISVGYVLTTGSVPVPSLADPVTLLWVPFAARALWLVPTRSGGRFSRHRLYADGAVACSALLFASWVAVFEPLTHSAHWTDQGREVILAFPICDMFMAAAVLSLLPRVRVDLRPLFSCLALGLLLIAVADSWAVVHLANTGSASFGAHDVLFQAGLGALIVAALTRSSPVLRSRSSNASLSVNSLPFLPILLAVSAGLFHRANWGRLDLADGMLAILVLAAITARTVLFTFELSLASEEHLAARVDLEKAHGDLARAQELAGIGSWEWDIASDTMTWSDQRFTLLGLDRATYTPTIDSFLQLVHPDDHARVAELTRASTEEHSGLDFECRMLRPDGSVRHIHELGEWVTGADGAVVGLFGTSHDVTERKLLQAEIEHLAFHDPLTGLANRRLFLDRLGHALSVVERSGRGCAVLFMDLDGFKTINDTFGHGVGDELLRELATRLTNAAREVDTIARLGGDEFAILCEDVDLEMATQVAERVREALRRPVDLEGSAIVLRASIGIAVAEDAISAEEILRDADAAMYAVKIAGKDTYRVFSRRVTV
jgi:diguanylate cyclase (GGDEF)-like protein